MKKTGIVWSTILLVFMLFMMTMIIEDQTTTTIDEVVEENPAQIAGYSTEYQDILYTTKREEMISKFLNAMEQLEFEKSTSESVSPNQNVQLFNKEGKLIANVEISGEKHITINNETFKLDESSSEILKPFWDQFYEQAKNENVTF
ncbi:hypothetical protein SAMN05421676_11180 [Salinibacillus kushneri]|uniref:Uncharacterized protein n=1 Tax=Salinibacillus kushneri TaxID=237682 RepID=A0A1I0IA69_9BACI|nr:hypothetical protein [Salinibacillus kushneri]SET93670.1 hypothetical protein SAMN05421676_11180 [Salinibacillus kushneri]